MGRDKVLVHEKPFQLGDTITRDLGFSDSCEYKNCMLDIENEIKLAFDAGRHINYSHFHEEMKNLGLERYSAHKTRCNVYVMFLV